MLQLQGCTLTELYVGFWLPPLGGLEAICQAMLTNTTVEELTIGFYPWRSREDGCSPPLAKVGAADAEALAAMLRTNRTLTKLDIRRSGILCNGLVVDEGLSHNNSIKDLAISLDPAGAQALVKLLQQGTATTCTHTDSSSAGCPQLPVQVLRLGHIGRGLPTAGALRDMQASNGTLLHLDLHFAPYSKKEWAATIFPALANNLSIQTLGLRSCWEVDGRLVATALVKVLESNTCMERIDLNGTPLEYDYCKGGELAYLLQTNTATRGRLSFV